MKFKLITVILFTSLFSFSQELVENNLPKIEFQNSIFDFGEIEYNSVANHNFVFKNVGKGPLIIKSVQSS